MQRLGRQDLGVDLLGLGRAAGLLLFQLGDDDQEVTSQVAIVGAGRGRPQPLAELAGEPAAAANPSSASRFFTSEGSISNSARLAR